MSQYFDDINALLHANHSEIDTLKAKLAEATRDWHTCAEDNDFLRAKLAEAEKLVRELGGDLDRSDARIAELEAELNEKRIVCFNMESYIAATNAGADLRVADAVAEEREAIAQWLIDSMHRECKGAVDCGRCIEREEVAAATRARGPSATSEPTPLPAEARQAMDELRTILSKYPNT